ncbi:hypothetical protein AVEN_29856-1 [Araneus ventricosus]|uniref:Uncharacterized protein n=1 Tax=Araneus ventricosus TaxID=182803 RepID=A0A4Y2JQ49_ARAVE|nr:hypothetical protein AVEN_29856-1 [Araneus ventricosus]
MVLKSGLSLIESVPRLQVTEDYVWTDLVILNPNQMVRNIPEPASPHNLPYQTNGRTLDPGRSKVYQVRGHGKPMVEWIFESMNSESMILISKPRVSSGHRSTEDILKFVTAVR